jgi:hypothetical protein
MVRLFYVQCKLTVDCPVCGKGRCCCCFLHLFFFFDFFFFSFFFWLLIVGVTMISGQHPSEESCGNYSIYQCLESYTAWEQLTEENKYYCRFVLNFLFFFFFLVLFISYFAHLFTFFVYFLYCLFIYLFLCCIFLISFIYLFYEDLQKPHGVIQADERVLLPQAAHLST